MSEKILNDSTVERHYVDLNGVKLCYTGLDLDIDYHPCRVVYETVNNTCYIYTNSKNCMLSPFLAPNGTPYKYDKNSDKFYY